MRLLPFGLILVHGLIHLVGFAKAFSEFVYGKFNLVGIDYNLTELK